MLLQECICLVSESPANTNTGREPFQLQQPIRKAPAPEAALMVGIYREFPLVLTPLIRRTMDISGRKTEPDGTCYIEHEVLVDYDASNGGINSWTPFALNGAVLGREDAERLKQYLGDLTDQERDNINDVETEKSY